jgi:putative ABC transport system substrate-binding protein
MGISKRRRSPPPFYQPHVWPQHARAAVAGESDHRDLEGGIYHHVDALIVMPDPFFISRREQLVELVARHSIPAIYPSRMFADLGGLMSYGSGQQDLYERGGMYVGKILKGAKLGDLPIQQSTKVELVINLKTAKALSLIIPPQLLAPADEVIE